MSRIPGRRDEIATALADHTTYEHLWLFNPRDRRGRVQEGGGGIDGQQRMAEFADSSGSRPEVIVVAVRWYLRFNLSHRDVEELLVERGVEVDHVSVYRWVQRFAALLADAARFCRHAPGHRWLVDET